MSKPPDPFTGAAGGCGMSRRASCTGPSPPGEKQGGPASSEAEATVRAQLLTECGATDAGDAEAVPTESSVVAAGEARAKAPIADAGDA